MNIAKVFSDSAVNGGQEYQGPGTLEHNKAESKPTPSFVSHRIESFSTKVPRFQIAPQTIICYHVICSDNELVWFEGIDENPRQSPTTTITSPILHDGVFCPACQPASRRRSLTAAARSGAGLGPQPAIIAGKLGVP